MQKLSLVDLLGKKTGKSPIKYQRSATDPLDCIFGSPSLQIKNGGCLTFSRLLSDHRGLWIDTTNELIFGYTPPPLTHPDTRRLKTKDPRVVKRYSNLLDLEYRK